MKFTELVGNERVKRALISIAQNRRIANGYIFFGPCGIGKREFAMNFVKLLNCEHSKNNSHDLTVKPCNSCIQCTKIANNNHPDVIAILPEGGQIKIDRVREVQRLLSYSNFEAEYRCVIIDDSDKMNTISQNAFLKILEEPPNNTIFILITANINNILPTIVSRCQKVPFSPILATEFEKLSSVKDNYFSLKAALFSGSIAESKKSDDGTWERNMSTIENLFSLENCDIFEIMSNFTRDREEVNFFLKTLYLFISDGILLNSTVTRGECSNEYLGRVEKTLKIKNVYPIYNLLDSILKRIEDVEANCNINLACENLFIELRMVRKEALFN